jgi:hypothetical protein
MIFEKPDVLYFLFLLIIPILVHLFKLRKYKTTKFSNVALLERIQSQSRKSSTLKKWLILATRLLGLSVLILAFAKPFVPNSDTALEDNEVVIYLDNSFSMELPGEQLSLLEEAKQNLWENLKDEQQLTLFTNDNTWRKVTKSDIKTDFFAIQYSSNQIFFENLMLKAESLFEKQNARKSLFIITDALNFEDNFEIDKSANLDLNLIIKSPSSLENFNLASAKFQSNTTNKILEVVVESSTPSEKDVTVSLIEDESLVAKNKASFENNTTATVTFDLSGREFQKGKLEIEADRLSYDNTLYFNLNSKQSINILSLHSKSNSYQSFLSSIYQSRLFTFEEESISNFDYSKTSDFNLIILNELPELNPVLTNRLKDFIEDGGHLVIIPNENTTSKTYSQLLQGSGMFETSSTRKREVTRINFEHPLFENVLSEKVQNFDYPSTSKSFGLSNRYTPVLEFSNGEAFLVENNRLYSFASPLDTEFSNFINSPLVVPVFYNMAIQSSSAPLLYSVLGEENKIQVKASLGKDEVIKLVNMSQQVIPQQQKLGNSVELNTQYQPETVGHFEVVQSDSVLMNLSFNHDRRESKFYTKEVSNFGETSFATVAEAFNSYTEERKILELWTWLLIFAMGCFVLELLILRFLN